MALNRDDFTIEKLHEGDRVPTLASCSSLAGLDARCVSFYRAIYLSIYLSI